MTKETKLEPVVRPNERASLPTGPEIEHAIHRQNLRAEIVHLRCALTQIAEQYDAAPFGMPILGDDAATEFLTWLPTHVVATLERSNLLSERTSARARRTDGKRRKKTASTE